MSQTNCITIFLHIFVNFPFPFTLKEITKFATFLPNFNYGLICRLRIIISTTTKLVKLIIVLSFPFTVVTKYCITFD